MFEGCAWVSEDLKGAEGVAFWMVPPLYDVYRLGGKYDGDKGPMQARLAVFFDSIKHTIISKRSFAEISCYNYRSTMLICFEYGVWKRIEYSLKSR